LGREKKKKTGKGGYTPNAKKGQALQEYSGVVERTKPEVGEGSEGNKKQERVKRKSQAYIKNGGIPEVS